MKALQVKVFSRSTNYTPVKAADFLLPTRSINPRKKYKQTRLVEFDAYKIICIQPTPKSSNSCLQYQLQLLIGNFLETRDLPISGSKSRASVLRATGVLTQDWDHDYAAAEA